ATTFSDSEGKFSFSELSPNLYRVVVDDEKYRRIDQAVEINPLITSATFVHLSLVPLEPPRPENPAPGSNPNTVSSVELKEIPKGAKKEFGKGVKAEEDGRADDAIDHYKKAIKLAPDYCGARNNLGSAYM